MSKSRFVHLKPEILSLRKEGLSYSQIQERIGVRVPQSTLSNWCSSVRLSTKAQKLLRKRMTGDLYRISIVSQLARERRQRRRDMVYESCSPLAERLDDTEVAKIALAMLYLGEGSKDERGCVKFSNSNRNIIALFLKLLFQVYEIDIGKLRVTIGCRADQDVRTLERYWRKVINVPKIRFYKTRIDPRTVGKPSKKKDYKGVCCISYIDNRIQFELVNLEKVFAPSEGP